MERLGNDPVLRAEMAVAARARALAFDWPRYHAALIAVVEEFGCRPPRRTHHRPNPRVVRLQDVAS
jgi:hypothetical protein